MPKYSFIVPVYNTEKFLEKCIESLKNQTFADFEVLFVDDCSTDNSHALCKSICEEDSRFTVIKQEKNQGQSAARNVGIERASGKYLLFVDSDDYLEYDLLEKLDYLGEKKEFDIVTWGMYYNLNKSNGEVIISKSPLNYLKDLYEDTVTCENLYELWMNTFFASPCNKLYKADIVKKNNIKFNCTLVEFEDLVFNIDYCKNIESFAILKDSFYHYNQTEVQTSVYKRRWDRVKPFEVSNIVYDKIKDYIKEYRKQNVKIDDFMLYAYKSYGNEIEYAYRVKEWEEYEKTIISLADDKGYAGMLSYIHNPKLKKVILPEKVFLALHLRRTFVWFLTLINNKYYN